MNDLDTALAAAGIAATARVVPVAADRGVRFYAIAGAEALEAWQSLRTVAGVTGAWPVLLGARKAFDDHRAVMASAASGSPSELLAQAADIDAEAYFRGCLELLEENGELPTGDWPDEPEPATEISIHCDVLSRKPLREVILALVPSPLPWQALAFIPYGGWNECPLPAEQIAVHRYWHERHAAELVGIGGDTLECRVHTPPSTKAAASALALQHYAYCADIVDQGTESIDALAGGLLNGTAWFFWWD